MNLLNIEDGGILAVLISATAKGTALVLLVWIVTALGRKAAPARRHLAWSVAVVGILLLPLLSVKLPRWHAVSLPPAYAASEVLFVTTPRELALTRNVDAAGATSALSPSVPIESGQPLDWGGIAVWIWGLGICVLSLKAMSSLLRAREVVRKAAPAPAPVAGSVSALARQLGIQRTVRTIVCGQETIPAVFGHWRPVIIVPSTCSEWPEGHLRSVLVHELAHVKRSDWLLSLLGRLACVLFWFNPLAWLAAYRMRSEGELACDDTVLAMGVDGPDYAGHLLQVVRAAKRSVLMPMSVGMARTPEVESRIRAILDPRRRRAGFGRPAIVFTVTLGLCGIGLLAALRAGVAAEPTAPRKVQVADPAGMVVAKDNRAVIFGDTTVELVAVSDVRQGFYEDRAWKPDGAAAPSLMQGAATFHRAEVGGDTPHKRYLMISVKSARALDGSTMGLVPEAYDPNDAEAITHGLDGQMDDLKLEAGKAMSGVVPVSLSNPQNPFSFRMGIAAGEWRTVSSVKNPFRPAADGSWKDEPGKVDTPRFNLSKRSGLGFLDRAGRSHNLELMPESKDNALVAKRLIGIDDRGATIEFASFGGTYDGSPSGEVDREILGKIAEFRVQTRPYQWIEFRQIRWEPKVRHNEPAFRKGTASGIAPGFTQSLPNGFTVSVAGISGSSFSGGRWRFEKTTWRADGKLLAASPIPTPDISYDPRSWTAPTGPRVVYFDVQGAGTTDISTAIESVTTVNSPDWILGKRRINTMPGISSATVSYAPGINTADFRVGVAAGPWKTVAVRSVNFAARPFVKGKEQDSDVAVLLDDTPVIAIKDRDGKMVKGNFLPSGQTLGVVAVRLVGVDREGKEHPLTPAGHAYHGVEVFEMSAMRNSETENYSSVRLWELAEIRLQTRAFEWATFKGVAVDPSE